MPATIDGERCNACGECASVCPEGAIDLTRGCFARVVTELCDGCGRCAEICPAHCVETRPR